MVDFVELLSKDDVAGCQRKIQALVKKLTKDIILWEEELVSLAKAIEHYYHPKALSIILEELPQEFLEPFYTRLLNAEKLSPDIISGLTQFIVTKQNISDGKTLNLVRLLLFSAYPIGTDQLINLTGRLDAQCIGNLLLELRQNAFQKNINLDRKGLDKHADSEQNNYRVKYDIFLTAITLDASSSLFKLPTIIQNNRFLANLIIIKRISCSPRENVKKIIDDLLLNGHCYDWQEQRFKEVVLPVFQDILLSVDQKETNRLLSRYGQLTHPGHPSNEDKVRLLDQFYLANYSIERQLSCIQILADKDPDFLINYLSMTSIKSSELREKLLALLSIESFPGLIGHMFVLGKISLVQQESSGIFEDFIRVFCQKLKALTQAQDLIDSFAEHYHYLPEAAQLQVMKEMNKQLADKPLLKVQWLVTVKERQADVSILWPYYDELLRAFPKHNDISQVLLAALSREELLKLYVYLSQEKAPPETFVCFQELFSNKDRHPHLFFLMSNTPVIPKELFSGFVDSLDDSSMIELLVELIEKKSENSEYSNTLNQVMLKFSQRLSANKDNAIHQWTAKYFTKDLVVHLLENPDCVYELSSSTTWQWITWSSIPQALSFRIDRLLNETLLDDAVVQRIAINWLSHFRLHPEKLNLIFYNLNQSAENRNAIGQNNYFKIKKSCWEYLGCSGEYSEAAFEGLRLKFYDQTCFDPMLHKQAAEQLLLDNPSQGARLLALTQVSLPDHFSNALLLSLLVHSVHEDSQINWEKIKHRLKHKTLSDNISFYKALMDKMLEVAFNPLLVEKAYGLITQSPYFESLIKQFSEQDILWLIQHSSADVLKKECIHWFDLLIRHHGVEAFNLGTLLIHMPQDEFLMDTLFSHEILESPDNLAILFAQLASSPHSEAILVGLHKKIISHDASWMESFLMKVQASLEVEQTNMMTAHVLNACIMTVSEGLKTNDPNHRLIYRLQYELLNSLFKRADNEALQKECLQLTLNLLTQFSRLDRRWAEINFQSESTVQSIIHCLQLMNLREGSNALHQHPLADVFLDNLTVPVHQDLRSQARFQLFITGLIEYPSALRNKDHYLMLFDLLDSNHQHLLVKKLVGIQYRHPVHTTILPFIAAAMNITALYEMFTQQPEDFLIVEAIFSHPEGLKDLTQSQRSRLIETIQSGEQLFRILNGYTHPDRRFAFVASLYESVDNDWQRLSEKFAKWGLNKQIVAAISNYTRASEHQQVLDELLANKTFYRHYLDDYLQRPTVEMHLESGSFLEKMLLQRLLIYGPGQEFDASFLAYFAPKQVFENLKNQFEITVQGLAMAKVLDPMHDNDTVLNDALSAARWFHQLPLYSEAIAYILAEYVKGGVVQNSIAQTTLFPTVIQPLLGLGEAGSEFMALSRRLPDLLAEFAEELNECQPKQSYQIKQVLALYQNKLATMTSFVPLRIYDFFKPEAVFSSLDPGKKMNFSSNDIELLTALPDTGALRERQLSLKKAMAIAFKKPDLMSNETVHNWLFEQIFLSPISAFIDTPLLRQYFKSAPLSIWTTKLGKFHKRIQELLAGLDDLAPLAQLDSFAAVLDYLQIFDAEPIAKLSEVARIMNMRHIADFMMMVCYLRKTNSLDVKRIIYQLLPPSENNDLGVEWLNSDARDIEGNKQFLFSRYEALVTQGFASDATSVDVSFKLKALKNAYSSYLSPDLLVICLNSYSVIFSNKKMPRLEFLQEFTEILKIGNQAEYIINAMHGDVIRAILEEAMNDPVHHQDLLHLMLNSNYQHFCQVELEKRLLAILNCKEDMGDEALYAVLVEKKSAGLSAEDFIQLTALYRLLAIAKPQGEFSIVSELNLLPDKPYQKQAFIADVSTCRMLENLNESQPKAIDWLKNQCHESSFSYRKTIDYLLKENPAKYPLAYYHWMLWRQQLAPHPAQLTEGFLEWLKALTDSSLIDNTKLSSLLQIIADRGMFSLVCQSNTIRSLEPAQLDWLCKATVLLDRFNTDYLKDLINISPLKRLEIIMPLITQHTLTSLSLEEIMALLKCIEDHTLKTMLVTHLLCRDDFIRRLSGTSFIRQLSERSSFSPPRLLPFLSQLKISLLTPETIAGLSDEAAVSCLFSVQHFHEWSNDQVRALIGRYPADSVFQHWVCHYSMMPNAMFILSHLFKQADSKIFHVMDRMPSEKKKALLSRLVRGLELFEFLKTGFVERSDESHLIEAIQLYNEGHHSEIRRTFIKALIKRLLTEGHHFSDKAVHSLFSLLNKEEFIEVNYGLAAVYNKYLRCSAVSSNSDIFYEEGAFCFARSQIVLPLQPQATKPKVQAAFEKALQQLLLQEDSNSQRMPEENPIIRALIEYNKPVKAIDYFLMHYQGKGSVLNKLLNEYFSRFELNSTDENLKKLQCTSILMIREEVPEMVRKAIFSAFKAHPALLKNIIAQNVFLFDPETMIKEYGMAQKYDELIAICDRILENESEKRPLNETTRTMIKTARDDALFEKRMGDMSGYFLSLRRWFLRCRRYFDWKNPFASLNSQYVASFDSESSSAKVFQSAPAEHNNPSLTAAEALKTALETRYYKNVHEALGRYKNSIPDEGSDLSLRHEVDDIYQSLLRDAPGDPHLQEWLETNQSRFIENRERILECLLQKGELADVRRYLDLYMRGPGNFASISERFIVENTLKLLPAVADEPEPDIRTKVHADLKAVADTAVDSVFKFAEFVGSWFWRSPQTRLLEQGTAKPSPAAQQNP